MNLRFALYDLSKYRRGQGKKLVNGHIASIENNLPFMAGGKRHFRSPASLFQRKRAKRRIL